MLPARDQLAVDGTTVFAISNISRGQDCQVEKPQEAIRVAPPFHAEVSHRDCGRVPGVDQGSGASDRKKVDIEIAQV